MLAELSQLRAEKTWKRKNATMKRGDTFIDDGKPTDLVIAIMGPPGVGKSTFVNALFGEGTAKLRDNPQSTMSLVKHIIRPLPSDPTRRLVVVEMPGFDDTYVDDAEILRRISVWLATSYVNDMKLAGIIYLHDISLKRMTVNARLNLEMFRKLCGDDAFPSVVLVATQWSELERRIVEARLQALKTNFWSDMIKHGSYVFKFENTNASAWSMVNYLLNRHDKEDAEYDVLQLQGELVDLQKLLPNTSAGKELRYTLEQRLKIQRDNATDEQLQKTSAAIQKLKVPIPTRLQLFFSLDGPSYASVQRKTTTVIKHERITQTVEINANSKRDVSPPSNTTSHASKVDRISSNRMEDTVTLGIVEETDNSQSTQYAGQVTSQVDLTRAISSSAFELATGNPIVDRCDGVAVSRDDVPNDSAVTTAPDVTQVDLSQSPDYSSIPGPISKAASLKTTLGQPGESFDNGCTIADNQTAAQVTGGVTPAPEVTQVDLPQNPDFCGAPVDSTNNIAKLNSNSEAQRSTAVVFERTYSVKSRITETASIVTPSEQPEESFNNGGTTADNQTATQVTADITTAPDVTQVDLPQSCTAPFDNENSTAELNSAAQGITALVIERRCSVESLVIEAASVKTTLQKKGSATDIQHATQANTDDVLQKSHQITSTTVTETQTTSVTGSQILGNARDFGISGAVMNDGANSTIHYTHTENHTTNDTHIHFHLRKPLGPKDRKLISDCIQRSKGDAELDNDGVHIHRRRAHIVGSSKKRSRLAKHVLKEIAETRR